jgi:hypothetical protein
MGELAAGNTSSRWGIAPALGPCPYSPERVEGEFCEVRHDGVLGSLGLQGYRKSRSRQSGRGPAGLRSTPWYT